MKTKQRQSRANLEGSKAFRNEAEITVYYDQTKKKDGGKNPHNQRLLTNHRKTKYK